MFFGILLNFNYRLLIYIFTLIIYNVQYLNVILGKIKYISMSLHKNVIKSYINLKLVRFFNTMCCLKKTVNFRLMITIKTSKFSVI